MSQLQRKILFPTAVYFKDLPNAKELNKYLFKEVKKWRKADPKGEAKVGGGEEGKYDTKKRVTTISWIPFDKLRQMYKVIENQLSIVNLNHFYFDGVRLTEPAQFTVYPKKGFYDWHMDCLLYTSPSPRDGLLSRMPSSA